MSSSWYGILTHLLFFVILGAFRRWVPFVLTHFKVMLASLLLVGCLRDLPLFNKIWRVRFELVCRFVF